MSEVWGLVTYTHIHIQKRSYTRSLSRSFSSVSRSSVFSTSHTPTPVEKATNWHIGCQCGCGGNVRAPRHSKEPTDISRARWGPWGERVKMKSTLLHIFFWPTHNKNRWRNKMPCGRSACFGFSSGRYMLQANFIRPPLGFFIILGSHGTSWWEKISFFQKFPHYLRCTGKIKVYFETWAMQQRLYLGKKKEKIGSKTKSPSCSNIKRRKSIVNPDRINDSAFIARAMNKSPGTVGHWVSLWPLILAFIDFSCHLECSRCEKCTVLSGFFVRHISIHNNIQRV